MIRPLLIITAIVVAPCARGAQKPSRSAPQSASAATCATSPDDDAIYSAALTKVILKDRNDRRQLVLLSQTSAGYPAGMASFTASSAPDKKELLDSASTETKSDFDAKAKLNCDLTRNTELKTSVVFMTAAERDELFSKTRGWRDFAQKYPNAVGFTIVSAIGFNHSHNEALVETGNSCGMLCGTGYVVRLEKKKDKWIATKTAKIWNAT